MNFYNNIVIGLLIVSVLFFGLFHVNASNFRLPGYQKISFAEEYRNDCSTRIMLQLNQPFRQTEGLFMSVKGKNWKEGDTVSYGVMKYCEAEHPLKLWSWGSYKVNIEARLK